MPFNAGLTVVQQWTPRSQKTVMNSRPGAGEDNVDFCYYAALALFQLQAKTGEFGIKP